MQARLALTLQFAHDFPINILDSQSDLCTTVGPLTMTSGILTTTGTGAGITVQRADPLDPADTTIDPAATEVGFNPQVTTNLGVIDGSGAAVTVTKAGSGTLLLDQANIGLAAATFKVQEGTLHVIGSDPWGGSKNVELAGGKLFIDGPETGAYEPGLVLGTLPGAMDYDSPNPRNYGVDPLGPTEAEVTANDPFIGTAWDFQTTLVYTGQI